MAKTFDVRDPDQYQAYLAESAAQMVLYGGICMQYDGNGTIAVLEPEDLMASSQAGFDLVMDDGRMMPFPAPDPEPGSQAVMRW